MLRKFLQPMVRGLFIRKGIKNISTGFITQYCFAAPKNIRLKSTHYFIMKIPNKRKFHQIAIHHSSDIDLKDLIKPYKTMLSSKCAVLGSKKSRFIKKKITRRFVKYDC